jgi:sec-independent protein translocase protein TatB
MLDIAPTEFLLVAFVALVVIGPKDLPKAMRFLGHWLGRARAIGRQFRAGFDEMVREAELEEMEKKWKAENERIMREHPQAASPAPPPVQPDPDMPPAPEPYDDLLPRSVNAPEPAAQTTPTPAIHDAPRVEPAPAGTPAPPADKAPS